MIEHVREVVSLVTHEQRLELVTRRRKREHQEPKPRERNLLFGLHERIFPHVYLSPSPFLSASPPPPVPESPAHSWKSFQGSRAAPADTLRER